MISATARRPSPRACSRAGDDVGAWIIRNGWAEAAPGGPYEDAEAEARRDKRGIWR